MERPTKINYYLKLAADAALRSTCLKRKYGAVIVKDDRIVSTGYNGAPRGRVNCGELGCPRMNVPNNTEYSTCRSVHAEANAIIHASYADLIGSDLYLAGFDCKTNSDVDVTEPCPMCKRFIINAQINRVIVPDKENGHKIFSVKKWTLPAYDDSIPKVIDQQLTVKSPESKSGLVAVPYGSEEPLYAKQVSHRDQVTNLAEKILSELTYDKIASKLAPSQWSDDLAKLFVLLLTAMDCLPNEFNEMSAANPKLRLTLEAFVKAINMLYCKEFESWDPFSAEVKHATLDIIAEGLALYPLSTLTENNFHQFAQFVSDMTEPKHELDANHLLTYSITFHDDDNQDEKQLYLEITCKRDNRTHVQVIDKDFVRKIAPAISIYGTLMNCNKRNIPQRDNNRYRYYQLMCTRLAIAR